MVFLQARWPSLQSTNSIKTLKETLHTVHFQLYQGSRCSQNDSLKFTNISNNHLLKLDEGNFQMTSEM